MLNDDPLTRISCLVVNQKLLSTWAKADSSRIDALRRFRKTIRAAEIFRPGHKNTVCLLVLESVAPSHVEEVVIRHEFNETSMVVSRRNMGGSSQQKAESLFHEVVLKRFGVRVCLVLQPDCGSVATCHQFNHQRRRKRLLLPHLISKGEWEKLTFAG